MRTSLILFSVGFLVMVATISLGLFNLYQQLNG